ncbi:hypothetical protein V8E53_006463 [Lactarius tabidus]
MLDANATIPQPLPEPSPPVTTNGLHCDHLPTDPDSPIADSPDTPVNTVSDVAVKISSDVAEVESDVRHESFEISLSKLDDASIGQIDTPIDPNPIQIELAHGTYRLSLPLRKALLTPPSRPSRGCRDGRC